MSAFNQLCLFISNVINAAYFPPLDLSLDYNIFIHSILRQYSVSSATMMFVQVIFVSILLVASINAVFSTISPPMSHVQHKNVYSKVSSIFKMIGNIATATVEHQFKIQRRCENICRFVQDRCFLRCQENNGFKCHNEFIDCIRGCQPINMYL